MAEAPVPIVSVIIGEGGSEGALALGLSDRILMQQYSIYSPISLNRHIGGPYPDHMLDREAAEALMLTAQDCLELSIADQIVCEPEDGAHTSPREAANAVGLAVARQLAELARLSTGKLLKRRVPEVPPHGGEERLLPGSHESGSGTVDEYHRRRRPQRALGKVAAAQGP